jgi:hypothetical protein
MNWNTLHIFGYGQVQLISNTENKLVDSNLCPSTQSVVDMIYSHKPQGNTASINYRTINVLNDLFADYQSEEGMFRTDYSELDISLIDQLISEIQAA